MPDIVNGVRTAIKNSVKSSTIPSSAKAALMDADRALMKGVALPIHGLTEGPVLGAVKSDEAFRRLHAARKMLDDGLRSISDTKSDAFRLLKNERQNIDEFIKRNPAMQAADEGIFSWFTDSRKIIQSVFKQRKIGSSKACKSIGDNDQAVRLQESLPVAKAFFSKYSKDFPEWKDNIQVIEKLEQSMATAERGRLIGKAKGNPSGTGDVIAQMQENLGAGRGRKTQFLETLGTNAVRAKNSIAQFEDIYVSISQWRQG